MATINSWGSNNPAQVAKGGTGNNQFTNLNQVIIGGSTATGALQQVAGGTAGQVLTATGTTSAPIWADIGSAATTCAFRGYLSTDDWNCTGDGTEFVVGSGNPYTIELNIGSNFSTDGYFTAPTDGYYVLYMSLQYRSTASSTAQETIGWIATGTSASIIAGTFPLPARCTGFYGDNRDNNINNAQIYCMSAGEKAWVMFEAGTGIKDISVVGCIFSGYLLSSSSASPSPASSCSFSAYLSADQTGLTSGVWTKANFDATLFNAGSVFDTTNHNFVAPSNGYYQLITTITYQDLTAYTRYLSDIQLVTTTMSYVQDNCAFYSDDGGQYQMTCSWYVYMNASDTAYINVQCGGGTFTYGLDYGGGSTDLRCFFYGYRVVQL